jgi:glycosyltransferase involved in cell wall biosynthesis
MDTQVSISVVSPVYGCPGAIPELCKRLHLALQAISNDYEIILVEDGSPDDSWARILKECAADSRVKGIKLSRNFGQHYAITAGLDFTKGEWVVVMDCDLQDRPEDIGILYETAIKENRDMVLARRVDRHDHWRKRLGSALFYKAFSWLSGTHLDPSVGTFRILTNQVVVSFRRMGECHRLFNGMVQWLGFSVGYADVSHSNRFEGKTSYTLRRLLKLAADGIVSFSIRPLLLGVGIGAAFALLSFLYGVYLVLRLIVTGPFGVQGWVSTVLLVSFLGGLILLCLGILGLYIGRIYQQVKGRPVYVVGKLESLDPCQYPEV